MGQGIFCQEFLHFRPGDCQHRANHIPADRSNGPQSFQAGTADHTHKHRLGIIVRRMRCGNFAGKRTQKCIPCVPGSSLQPFFSGDDRPAAHMERNIIATADFSDKSLIPIRLIPPKVMVKMGSLQLDLQLVFQQVQGKQQRNGIRAAGYRRRHPVPRRDQSIFPVKGTQFIQHASTPDPQRTGTDPPTGALPYRSRRDGFLQQCIPLYPSPRCSDYNTRPDTKT